jgi:multidrug resistance efflux pump
MKKPQKIQLTGVIVLIAVLAVLFKYWTYLANPWTRDGQVRAEVIQVTPRVSGPIVNLPIRDNQFVKAGDLLFEIDPRTYQVSLEQARANLEQTGEQRFGHGKPGAGSQRRRGVRPGFDFSGRELN